mgnify:CR=1 FL=1
MAKFPEGRCESAAIGGHSFALFAVARLDHTPQTLHITDLIHDGGLAAHLGLPELSPAEDRVMICGSEAMLADLKVMLEMRG